MKKLLYILLFFPALCFAQPGHDIVVPYGSFLTGDKSLPYSPAKVDPNYLSKRLINFTCDSLFLNGARLTAGTSITGLTTGNYTKATSATTIGNALLYDRGRAVILPQNKIFGAQDTARMYLDFGNNTNTYFKATLFPGTSANSFINVDTFNIALSRDATGVGHQSAIQIDDDGVELVDNNLPNDKEGSIHLDTITSKIYHTDSISLVATKTSVSGNFQIKDGTEGTDFVLQGDDEGNSTWVTPSSISAGSIGAAGDLISFTGSNTESNISAVATGYLLGSQGVSTKPAWLQAGTLNTSLTTPLFVGGTGVGSSAEIRSTSGAGATDFIKFTVGNNGATEAARFLTGGALLIGGTTQLVSGSKFEVQYNSDITGQYVVQNSSAGTSAIAQALIRNDQGATGNVSMGITSSNYTASGIYPQGGSFIRTVTTSLNIGTSNASGVVRFFSGSAVQAASINASGRTFLGGSTSATAILHLAAGTATASTAPLKFTSGTNLTTAEAGAMEYNGTNLFFTRTGTTRENVITTSAVNVVSPTSPNRTITVVIDGTTYYIAAKTTND